MVAEMQQVAVICCPQPAANSVMDDLAGRLSDLFRRYQVDFRRMAHLSAAEMHQATAPFRTEVSALIAEHGREAVIRAALLLGAGPAIRH